MLRFVILLCAFISGVDIISLRKKDERFVKCNLACNNGVARTPKKLRTTKGDYWIEQ